MVWESGSGGLESFYSLRLSPEGTLDLFDTFGADDGSPLPRLNLDVWGAPWVADLLLHVGERVAAAEFSSFACSGWRPERSDCRDGAQYE